MNIAKMKEVFSDEAFVKNLFALETAVEVQAALKEKGVEFTEAQILAIRDLLGKVASGEISAGQLEQWAAQAESDELSDEMLEKIAGGASTGDYILGAIVTVMMPAAGLTSYIMMAVEDKW